MSKFNLIIFSIFIFPSSIFYAQKEKCTDVFNIGLKKTGEIHHKEINFQKAYLHFIQNQYDSTLIYCHAFFISNNHNQTLSDYCHYMRAYSFMKKKLYSNAKKEFKLVSTHFPYPYLIKISLGNISLECTSYKNALEYYKSVEKTQKNNKANFKISTLYHNIGLCYLYLTHYTKAEEYLFKSLKLQEKEKNPDLLISSYMDIANLYYTQYKDNLAIPYFEKAYQLSKKTKDFELKQNAAINMAAVEENRGNLSASIAYRKEYEKWKDSLNDQNKIWEIAEKEKKFTVNLKEQEIKVLETENEIKIAQRNGFIYSSILLFGLFGVSIYFYKQKIKTNKIILSQKNKLDELNATKDQLFSIVSHDLRSSVNALKTSNTKLSETLETKNYSELEKLLQTNSSIANGAYNLLDNLLNWALLQTKQLYFHKETLHLHSIIQQVEYNYKPLFLDKKIHFENRIMKHHFIIADLDSFKIILRNILDNAIKFSKENGSISIYTVDSTDDFLHIIIEDTGLGMTTETRKKLIDETILLSKKNNEETIGTGLGVQLCKTMIQKNDGKMQIESQENIGTKIIIILPKAEKNG